MREAGLTYCPQIKLTYLVTGKGWKTKGCPDKDGWAPAAILHGEQTRGRAICRWLGQEDTEVPRAEAMQAQFLFPNKPNVEG